MRKKQHRQYANSPQYKQNADVIDLVSESSAHSDKQASRGDELTPAELSFFQRKCNETIHFVNRFQYTDKNTYTQNSQRAADHKKKRRRRFEEADEKEAQKQARV